MSISSKQIISPSTILPGFVSVDAQVAPYPVYFANQSVMNNGSEGDYAIYLNTLRPSTPAITGQNIAGAVIECNFKADKIPATVYQIKTRAVGNELDEIRADAENYSNTQTLINCMKQAQGQAQHVLAVLGGNGSNEGLLNAEGVNELTLPQVPFNASSTVDYWDGYAADQLLDVLLRGFRAVMNATLSMGNVRLVVVSTRIENLLKTKNVARTDFANNMGASVTAAQAFKDTVKSNYGIDIAIVADNLLEGSDTVEDSMLFIAPENRSYTDLIEVNPSTGIAGGQNAIGEMAVNVATTIVMPSPAFNVKSTPLGSENTELFARTSSTAGWTVKPQNLYKIVGLFNGTPDPITP